MDANAAQTSGTLGELIHRARERAGLSLRNLEAITGISRNMLYRLEYNQVGNPSADTLLRLAEALELNSDDLFALMGYEPRTSSMTLPSLAPYLRTKYRLPPRALAEASEALQSILEKYDRVQGAQQAQQLHKSKPESTGPRDADVTR
jgi:transcriptional regulator with XRE-family HTH domain